MKPKQDDAPLNETPCPHCGASVNDRAPACPQCGEKIYVEVPGQAPQSKPKAGEDS